MLNRLIYIITYFLVSFSLVFSQFNHKPGQVTTPVQLTGEDYITGEDGVPRMSINIWGHVKYPGTYLVYDGIDFLTCLSMAGGPMKGAKLSKVTIISEDGLSRQVDLKSMLDKNIEFDAIIPNISLKPHDTIYIDETFGNYVLSKSGIINTLLQLTNLLVILSRS